MALNAMGSSHSSVSGPLYSNRVYRQRGSKALSLAEIRQKTTCWGPAPADPGYSKERRPRRLFIC